jgi:hypothetical protein
MHLIPTSSVLAEKMKNIRAGQIVRIVGQLVEARAPDGWRWTSSLTRNDTGAGACELIRVSRSKFASRKLADNRFILSDSKGRQSAPSAGCLRELNMLFPMNPIAAVTIANACTSLPNRRLARWLS